MEEGDGESSVEYLFEIQGSGGHNHSPVSLCRWTYI